VGVETYSDPFYIFSGVSRLPNSKIYAACIQASFFSLLRQLRNISEIKLHHTNYNNNLNNRSQTSARAADLRVGHGSLFQNPTQPKISGPNQPIKCHTISLKTVVGPNQPTKDFIRSNPTHHRHLVWHIRLHRKLYTTVTRHRQVHSLITNKNK